MSSLSEELKKEIFNFFFPDFPAGFSEEENRDTVYQNTKFTESLPDPGVQNSGLYENQKEWPFQTEFSCLIKSNRFANFSYEYIFYLDEENKIRPYAESG